jgi:hypothetical protein
MQQQNATASTSSASAANAAVGMMFIDLFINLVRSEHAAKVLYAEGLDSHDALVDKLALHAIYPAAQSRHDAAVSAASSYTTNTLEVSKGQRFL